MDSNCKANEELRPCCVCPETRKIRDECVLYNGPESPKCAEIIQAHIKCLQSYGFIVQEPEKNN